MVTHSLLTPSQKSGATTLKGKSKVDKELPKLTTRQIERQLKTAFRKANQTEEQKAHVKRQQKYAAKREAARQLTPKEQKAKERGQRLAMMAPITVTLTLRHTVNNDSYGPGQVTIPRHLALTFQAAEYRYAKAEERFYSTRSAIIGPKVRGAHVVVPVANETFEDSWTNPRIISNSVSGKNMTDTGEGRKF